MLNDAASEFFKKAAPVTIEITDDGLPIVRIHNPAHPDALLTIIGSLAAMDALSSGADEVTDEMIDRATPIARELLAQAVAQLDAGARQAAIMVNFRDEAESADER